MVCPFAWVTSRWLRELEDQGAATVTWRPMCLGITNEDEDLPPEWQDALTASWRGARVSTVIDRDHGSAAVGRFYTAVGTRIHVDGRSLDADLIREALVDAGLPAEIAEVMDDTGLDAEVRARHAEGQAAVGDKSGTPVVAIGGRGYFGPVLTQVPRGDEAVALLRAVEVLCRTPGLAELKRSRDDLLISA